MYKYIYTNKDGEPMVAANTHTMVLIAVILRGDIRALIGNMIANNLSPEMTISVNTLAHIPVTVNRIYFMKLGFKIMI